MTDIRILSNEGKEAGTKAVPKEWSERTVSFELIHQVAVGQAQNQRVSRAHTKDRGDRRGGGRKPWRQKGTGMARHGSRRSPIWRGGGVTFGPSSERTYGKKIPVSMQRAALRDVLIGKIQDNELLLVEEFPEMQGRTKEVLGFLETLTKERIKPVLLVVSGGAEEKRKYVRRAASNIQDVMVANPENVSVIDLLQYRMIVADKEAFDMLIERTQYRKKASATVNKKGKV